MKTQEFLRQIREVNRLREWLDGTAPPVSSRKAKADVMRVYGRTVSRATWGRWCDKCGITSKLLSEYGGDYPAGAYLLLMVNAKLLRGNGPGERSKKVSRDALIFAVREHRSRAKRTVQQLPARITAQELVEIAESRSGKTFHRRTHEKRGIKRTKRFYIPSEAARILDQYPILQIGV